MLPGYVSGFYSFDECHIDLAQLSRYAGAALVQQEATGIDINVHRGWCYAFCGNCHLLPEPLICLADRSVFGDTE
jgi:hypothetical protein